MEGPKPQERRAMNTETGTGKVINSPGFGGKEKGREMRKPPCTPLREKGKGKETRRGSCEPDYKTARAYARETGPQNLHDEKIMKALKIGLRMYQKSFAAVRKTLV